MQGKIAESLILPNFLVIGAQKAATTSIYFLLKSHYDVFMAEKKELHFFNTDYNHQRGLRFYSSYFLGWKGEKAIGEATPGYLHNPEVPKRIYDAIPNVKLIVSLRDPIDRAYSAYVMQQSKGSEFPGRSFEEAVKATPEYIEFGRYHKHLLRYLNYFSKTQFCILLYEELKTDPHKFYKSIFDFLEIDRLELLQEDLPRPNLGGISKRLWVQKSLYMLYQSRNYIRNGPLNWMVTNSQVDRLSRKMRNKIAGWNRKRGYYPKLNPEVRENLLPLVRDANNALADKFDIDISSWNTV
jgi:hypothetical protein